MVMLFTLPSVPRAFKSALQIISVVAWVLLIWLYVSSERQHASEQQLQTFQLMEKNAQHRVDVLTGQITTLLRVLQMVGGTPLERDASRAWMQPFRQILADDPLISGLTVVDEHGRSWGVGKVRGDGWVKVTPFRDELTFQNLQFDDAHGNAGASHIVSTPRLVSPWFEVMTMREGQILWTAPFTSTVISEPVISAAIKGRHGHARAYAAHIRLADLQILSDASQNLPPGAVVLVDRQGRLVARTRIHAGEALGLLAAISDLRLEPFNTMLDHWLKAGKPLRTIMPFEILDGSTEYTGWVSPVRIGGLEFYLMAALPGKNDAFSQFALRWLLPARAARGEKRGAEGGAADT